MSLPYISTPDVAFGSDIITIAATDYVAENVNITEATREIRRNGITGDETDLQVRKEPGTLTATLQLATTSTPAPAAGATFTYDGIEYVVVNPERVKSQGEYRTVNLNGRETP